MRTFLALVLAFGLLIPSAFAVKPAQETWALERPDGSLIIYTYVENSDVTMEQDLQAKGIDGLPRTRYNEQDFPANGDDRKYWKKGAGKIEVDTTKKAQDEAGKAAKKDKVLTKLKLTEGELTELKDVLQEAS